jgi:hypothetical protein
VADGLSDRGFRSRSLSRAGVFSLDATVSAAAACEPISATGTAFSLLALKRPSFFKNRMAAQTVDRESFAHAGDLQRMREQSGGKD